MNLMIILLILVSFLSKNVSAIIIEPKDSYIHKVLLTENLEKTSEISFTFSKVSSECFATKELIIEFSVGSAKSGSSSTIFYLYTSDITDTDEMNVGIKTKDNTIVRGDGKVFEVTLRSKDKMELIIDGKMPPKVSGIIPNELNFDKYNSTHLAVVFYAWIQDPRAQKCSYNFDFPNYVELKSKTSLLPGEDTTSSTPSDKASSKIPTNSTSKFAAPGSSESGTNSTLIYVCVAVGTLLLGIIISAVASYFLLPKLSYFKPPTDDATKIDGEKTKMETSTVKTTMQNQDETINLETKETKETKSISKADNNNTTKQQTLNGIPTIDTYEGGKTKKITSKETGKPGEQYVEFAQKSKKN